MIKKLFLPILFLISIVIFSNCKKEPDLVRLAPILPTLITTAITSITDTTAQSGGNITTGGSAAVIARGVCWSTSANPTTANSKTTDGSGTGVFSSSISRLTAGATYYVRAYATNSAGTAYGNEISFTTTPGLPTLTTTAVTFITGTTALSGGNITADGGGAVIARGVCWSTSADPTIANSKTTDGSGTGVFSSSISGLTAGVTYYVRAYATNSAGTAYNNQVSFTTTTTPGSGDIYVAGYEYIGTKSVAKIWKNGVATSLTNGSNNAETNSVYVLGTDVYGAGYEISGTKKVAKVWKNGVATSLTNGSNDAAANSVYVSGTDVYVAGYEYTGTKSVAKIWKNGVATTLAAIGSANSVYVSGIDVYVAGYGGSVAIVWKNGVATSLTNGSNNAQAYSVYVSGTDVYVAGGENGTNSIIAKVWKNGISTSLSGDGLAYSVYVSGTDVYVAGYEDFFNPVATVWKNGVAIPLTSGSNYGIAYSIFVK